MSLNLLPSQAKFQVEVIKAKSRSKKVLLLFLAIWVVLVAAVLVLEQGDWWLQRENVKYEAAVADYLRYSTEIVSSQTVKFKAKLLGQVLGDRFEYSNAFGVVDKIFNPGVIIKDFQLKEKSFFVMTVIAKDEIMMKSIETRAAQINSGEVAELKKMVIKSASFTKTTAQWLVDLEVYINE